MKKIISLLLAFVLTGCLLTACGSSSDDGPSESDEIDTSVEDLCYATTGVHANDVIFTVDGEDVTMSMFLYWLAYDISYYDSYASYYEDIDYDLEEQRDTLMEDARNISAEYVMMCTKPKEMGYMLSDEVMSLIENDIDEIRESYGGEEEFQNVLRQMGLTEDCYDMIVESSYYAELMGQGEAGEPTYDDLEQYAEDNDLMYMKHILILTVDENYEPLSDEDVESKRQLAEDILTQIRESDDPEATFDNLMNEYSDDTGLSSYPDGYLFGTGEMVEPVEDAVRALNFGEISDVVEYDGSEDGNYSGYHIILRLDPADYDGIEDDWLNDQINAIVQDWLDNAKFTYTNAYNDFDIVSFYDKYTAYQEAFEEENEIVENVEVTAETDS